MNTSSEKVLSKRLNIPVKTWNNESSLLQYKKSIKYSLPLETKKTFISTPWVYNWDKSIHSYSAMEDSPL